jgi:hypothetical protein
VLEHTVIPAGALLADDDALARRYVDLVARADDDPVDMADFLAHLVTAANAVQDLDLLGYSDGQPKQRATLLGLFGLVAVSGATSVMLGSGNRMLTEFEVDHLRFQIDGIDHGVANYRKKHEEGT